MKPIKLSSVVVPKGWGHEVHICNNDEFCGKELHIQSGGSLSVHFHITKREVFRLRFGMAVLEYIEMTKGFYVQVALYAGDVIEIPRHLPHRLIATTDCIVDEYSTPDSPGDSYRVAPGDSQK